MSGAEKAVRVLPLVNVFGRHEHDWSRYYDFIRIPMSDGTVITYRREIEQPHPQCVKTIELIRSMDAMCGYKGKHTKK